MKRPSLKHQDPKLLYAETPSADYLKDIEIQDEYEDVSSELIGLSDQQVSAIARDSINAARDQTPRPKHQDATNQSKPK